MNVGDRLRKLLALANRGGTSGERDAARRRAERLAERERLALVTASNGELIAVEPDRAELLEALDRIIHPREPELLVSAERLGHDFGRTPMGHGQVVEAAARRRGGSGTPGGGVALDGGAGSVPGEADGANGDAAAASTICICDPEFAALEIYDGRCPTHGLEATLRAAGARLREDDRV